MKPEVSVKCSLKESKLASTGPHSTVVRPPLHNCLREQSPVSVSQSLSVRMTKGLEKKV